MKHLKQETVYQIIALADATEGYVFQQHLSTLTTAEQSLRRAIAALNDGERAEFMALLWLGRGDAGPEHWDGLVAHAYKHDAGPSVNANYAASKSRLAEFLRDGLAKLHHFENLQDG